LKISFATHGPILLHGLSAKSLTFMAMSPARQAYGKVVEDSSDETSDVEGGESVEVEIQKNVYGAALLAIAQVSDKNYVNENGKHQAFGRLANGILLFLLGCCVQIVLLSLLYLFSEERMQDPYEQNATDVLAEELRAAMKADKALPESHYAVGLCLQDHSLPWSQSMVSFVWLCKCVPAIVNAIWETVVLASLPSGHITINNSETIKLKVVAMSAMPKIIATILIAVPLVCLELASAYVGMRFLMYCHALGELLVKALSLSYIQTVPGVVFAGLSSKAFQLEVNKSFLAHKFKRPIYSLESWLSGLVKITCVLAVIYWYCRVKHGHLQDFRLACYRYKYQFVFPFCGQCGLDFFGLKLAN